MKAPMTDLDRIEIRVAMNGVAYRAMTSLDQDASPDMLKLCKEVRRLQAELDKLPKTTDGVRITPGMLLYYFGMKGLIEAECSSVGVGFWNEPFHGTHYQSDENRRPTYSSREAAEAARKATP